MQGLRHDAGPGAFAQRGPGSCGEGRQEYTGNVPAPMWTVFIPTPPITNYQSLGASLPFFY
jgi:hypothetical protein